MEAYNFKISAHGSYFYVHDKKTGKLLIEKSFREYQDALSAAKKL